ncbi:MAG: hypothetical protein JO006_19075 [Paucibacter sp.]|nr:hypothetical protein [Roseateles sp.]
MLEHFFAPPLRLGLAEASIALIDPAASLAGAPRRREAAWPQLRGEPLDFDALLAHLDALLDEAGPVRGRAVRVLLCDAWLRLWVVRPPSNALQRADCEAAAAVRFEALYGEPLDGRFHLSADWAARRPFVAAAIETARLQALRSRLAARGLHMDAVQPHLVAAWNRWHRAVPEGAWFGTLHEDTLCLLMRVDADPAELRCLTVDAAARVEAAWLRQALQREALRLGVAAPACVALTGAVPGPWAAVQGPEWRCVALDAAAPTTGQPALQLLSEGGRA